MKLNRNKVNTIYFKLKDKGASYFFLPLTASFLEQLI